MQLRGPLFFSLSGASCACRRVEAKESCQLIPFLADLHGFLNSILYP